MSVMRIYKLTPEGRKYAGNINPNHRDPVLDFLYKVSAASIEEIAAEINQPPGAVRSSLAKKGRLVIEINGG